MMHEFVLYLDKNPRLISLFRQVPDAVAFVTASRWAPAGSVAGMAKGQSILLDDAIFTLTSGSNASKIAKSGLLVPRGEWSQTLNDVQCEYAAALSLSKLGMALVENTMSDLVGVIQLEAFDPSGNLGDYHFADSPKLLQLSVKLGPSVDGKYRVAHFPSATNASQISAYQALTELGIITTF